MFVKLTLLWIGVIALFVSGLWFFHESSQFLMDQDYLAGLLHVLVGLAIFRAGVDVARMGVVMHLRSQ